MRYAAAPALARVVRVDVRLGCPHGQCADRCPGRGDRRRRGGDPAGHRTVRAAPRDRPRLCSATRCWSSAAWRWPRAVARRLPSWSSPGCARWAIRRPVSTCRRRLPGRGVRRRAGRAPRRHGGGERDHAGRAAARGHGLRPARHRRGVRAGPGCPRAGLADRRRCGGRGAAAGRAAGGRGRAHPGGERAAPRRRGAAAHRAGVARLAHPPDLGDQGAGRGRRAPGPEAGRTGAGGAAGDPGRRPRGGPRAACDPGGAARRRPDPAVRARPGSGAGAAGPGDRPGRDPDDRGTTAPTCRPRWTGPRTGSCRSR